MTDVLDMAADGARGGGRFPLALERAQRILESEIERGMPRAGWARIVLAEFFLGRWDDCLAHAQIVVDDWEAKAEPPASWFAGSLAVAAAICGYRRDPDESRWRGIFARLIAGQGLTVGPRFGHPLMAALTADVHLFHGRRQEARACVEEPATERGGMWRSLYAATRAEVVGGVAIEEAEPLLFGNAYAAAILRRARGDLLGAADGFAACGAAFEEARTRRLLDAGDARALATLERLGAA